jgi:TPR repeat protein
MKKYVCLLLLFTTTLFASDTQQLFWETYTEALRGDSEAQFLVGSIYEQGNIVEQDIKKAAFWYEKSAEQGHVDAEVNIGIMYARGYGVDVDEAKAILWFVRATNQGDQEAHKLLLTLLDEKIKNKNRSLAIQKSESSQSIDLSNCSEIPPVTLYTKKGGKICEKNNDCKGYKAKSVFTSTNKCGEFYKISGMVTKKGWKESTKEVWINESSIEHQH